MTLALRATVLYGVLVLACVILLAGPMVAIFVTDPGIAAAARDALRIIALAFAAYGVTRSSAPTSSPSGSRGRPGCCPSAPSSRSRSRS